MSNALSNAIRDFGNIEGDFDCDGDKESLKAFLKDDLNSLSDICSLDSNVEGVVESKRLEIVSMLDALRDSDSSNDFSIYKEVVQKALADAVGADSFDPQNSDIRLVATLLTIDIDELSFSTPSSNPDGSLNPALFSKEDLHVSSRPVADIYKKYSVYESNFLSALESGNLEVSTEAIIKAFTEFLEEPNAEELIQYLQQADLELFRHFESVQTRVGGLEALRSILSETPPDQILSILGDFSVESGRIVYADGLTSTPEGRDSFREAEKFKKDYYGLVNRVISGDVNNVYDFRSSVGEVLSSISSNDAVSIALAEFTGSNLLGSVTTKVVSVDDLKNKVQNHLATWTPEDFEKYKADKIARRSEYQIHFESDEINDLNVNMRDMFRQIDGIGKLATEYQSKTVRDFKGALVDKLFDELNEWAKLNSKVITQIVNQQKGGGKHKMFQELEQKHGIKLNGFSGDQLNKLQGKLDAFVGVTGYSLLADNPLFSSLLHDSPGIEGEIFDAMIENGSATIGTEHKSKLETAVDKLFSESGITDDDKKLSETGILKNFRDLEVDLNSKDPELQKKAAEDIAKAMKSVPKQWWGTEWEKSYEAYLKGQGADPMTFDAWIDYKPKPPGAPKQVSPLLKLWKWIQGFLLDIGINMGISEENEDANVSEKVKSWRDKAGLDGETGDPKVPEGENKPDGDTTGLERSDSSDKINKMIEWAGGTDKAQVTIDGQSLKDVDVSTLSQEKMEELSAVHTYMEKNPDAKKMLALPISVEDLNLLMGNSIDGLELNIDSGRNVFELKFDPKASGIFDGNINGSEAGLYAAVAGMAFAAQWSGQALATWAPHPLVKGLGLVLRTLGGGVGYGSKTKAVTSVVGAGASSVMLSQAVGPLESLFSSSEGFSLDPDKFNSQRKDFNEFMNKFRKISQDPEQFVKEVMKDYDFSQLDNSLENKDLEVSNLKDSWYELWDSDFWFQEEISDLISVAKDVQDGKIKLEDIDEKERDVVVALASDRILYFFNQLKNPEVAEQVGNSSWFGDTGEIPQSLLVKISKLPYNLEVANNEDGAVNNNDDADVLWGVNEWFGKDAASGDLKVKIKNTWYDFDHFDELERLIDKHG